ncbi:MAG: dTMP kinase [Candidatus Krumholzibacteriota bacterium]|nr:dTMP kinase [Candidatus Krumholzibacteriota bacterium]
MEARFVTFEGVEGSGKSTVARLVLERLGRAGVEAILTREPGGNPVSEAIRRVLLDPGNEEISPQTELLLYIAARAQIVDEVIRPSLAAGRWVLCDRFMDASVAYQGWARGIGEERVAELNAFAVGATVPSVTYLFDLPVEEGFRRGPERREAAGEGAPDRLERESRFFHERVREGYLRIASREPGRVVVVDAAAPLHEVVGRVLGNLRERFGVHVE